MRRGRVRGGYQRSAFVERQYDVFGRIMESIQVHVREAFSKGKSTFSKSKLNRLKCAPFYYFQTAAAFAVRRREAAEEAGLCGSKETPLRRMRAKR